MNLWTFLAQGAGNKFDIEDNNDVSHDDHYILTPIGGEVLTE